jgi:mannose-1-phosphate guanylyltransferase
MTEPGLEAVILAGGLGTRLGGALGNLPKTMAPVAGRPFLARLLDQLAAEGVGRVLLCLGHRAGPVLDRLASAPLPVEAIVEPRPLGTAGALRLALPRLGARPALVLNGDSWIDAPLAAFLSAHRRAGATGSLLCVEVEYGGRYGRVERDAGGRVVRFHEKDESERGPALVSAGRYLFEQPILDRLVADNHPSLENGLFQALPPGTLHTHAVSACFFDIGTPASLMECDAHFRALDRVPAQ